MNNYQTPLHNTELPLQRTLTTLPKSGKKAAKWYDTQLMQMVIHVEAHLMHQILGEENKKK